MALIDLILEEIPKNKMKWLKAALISKCKNHLLKIIFFISLLGIKIQLSTKSMLKSGWTTLQNMG